jgi:hypothetical protein
MVLWFLLFWYFLLFWFVVPRKIWQPCLKIETFWSVMRPLTLRWCCASTSTSSRKRSTGWPQISRKSCRICKKLYFDQIQCHRMTTDIKKIMPNLQKVAFWSNFKKVIIWSKSMSANYSFSNLKY